MVSRVIETQRNEAKVERDCKERARDMGRRGKEREGTDP